jgi:hypothetical protein
MAGKCTAGTWKGWTCLEPGANKYPVKSPQGKVDCSKVRAAASYGSRFGALETLVKAGLNTYRKQCGVESKQSTSSGSAPSSSSK